MIDWSEPRLDDWEFYTIDAGEGINGTEKPLKGVIGGTINWDYNSDTKVSGSLNFQNYYGAIGDVIRNAHIRIYYCPFVGGKRNKIELCTGYITSTTGTYEERLFTGEIEFQGELLRYEADQLPRNWTIPKNKSALDYYKAFHKVMGNAVYSWKNIVDKKFTSDKVIDFGEKPLAVLQYVADFLGAEIVTDTHGRIVLQKYIAPDKKPVTYTFPTGNKSIIYGALDVEETWNGTPNRAALRHTWTDDNGKEHVLYATAQLDSTNIISSSRQNRWITVAEDVSEMSPKTQAKINALAKTKLAENTQVQVKYTFSSFYAPFTTGDVIRFRYGKFDVDGLVQNIEMEVAPGAPMRTTVKRVRYRL